MATSEIALLSLGLAMDATAVAAARGLVAKRVRLRDMVTVALAFGGFQALMPLIGWQLGAAFGAQAAAWDHWIAFVLLVGIGIKMVRDGLGGGDECAECAPSGAPFTLMALLVCAVATSIDALAAGVTLPLLDTPPVTSLVVIGLTTAALSAAGIALGRHLGARLTSGVGARLPALGGLVLIALGSKILIEHLQH